MTGATGRCRLIITLSGWAEAAREESSFEDEEPSTDAKAMKKPVAPNGAECP
jgi:hypothetical protein